jgi:hypothetical protein
MNIQEIKQAVDSGIKVYWSNDGYEVRKDSLGLGKQHPSQYHIVFVRTGECAGLTRGGNLNGKPSEFYVKVTKA